MFDLDVRDGCDGLGGSVMFQVWRYNGRPVSSHTQHYQVLTEKRRDGLVSTLVIKDSLPSDFGRGTTLEYLSPVNVSIRYLSLGEYYYKIPLTRQRRCKIPLARGVILYDTSYQAM